MKKLSQKNKVLFKRSFAEYGNIYVESFEKNNKTIAVFFDNRDIRRRNILQKDFDVFESTKLNLIS